MSEDDEGPGLFRSADFWIGAVLSLAVWTGIWVALANGLDYLHYIR